MKFRNISLAWIFFLISAVANAWPAQIIIIRHGEKPADKKQTELSPQGCDRANALPGTFFKNITPNAIFAHRPSSDDGATRAIETIAPTADHYKVHIDADYSSATELAHELSNPKYNGKTIVISWVHQDIQNLAKQLGVQDTPENHYAFKKPWTSDTFDEAWTLNYKSGTPSLTIVPENALSSDNPRGDKHWNNFHTPADNSSDCIPAGMTPVSEEKTCNYFIKRTAEEWLTSRVPGI